VKFIVPESVILVPRSSICAFTVSSSSVSCECVERDYIIIALTCASSLERSLTLLLPC